MDLQDTLGQAALDITVLLALGVSLAIAGALAALIAWAVISHEDQL